MLIALSWVANRVVETIWQRQRHRNRQNQRTKYMRIRTVWTTEHSMPHLSRHSQSPTSSTLVVPAMSPRRMMSHNSESSENSHLFLQTNCSHTRRNRYRRKPWVRKHTVKNSCHSIRKNDTLQLRETWKHWVCQWLDTARTHAQTAQTSATHKCLQTNCSCYHRYRLQVRTKLEGAAVKYNRCHIGKAHWGNIHRIRSQINVLGNTKLPGNWVHYPNACRQSTSMAEEASPCATQNIHKWIVRQCRPTAQHQQRARYFRIRTVWTTWRSIWWNHTCHAKSPTSSTLVVVAVSPSRMMSQYSESSENSHSFLHWNLCISGST